MSTYAIFTTVPSAARDNNSNYFNGDIMLFLYARMCDNSRSFCDSNGGGGKQINNRLSCIIYVNALLYLGETLSPNNVVFG